MGRKLTSEGNIMVEKREWKEFRETGLLWLINQTLHLFGWAIVLEIEEEDIINVYPARVKFRGFDGESNTQGYIKVSEYLSKNIKDLLKESRE